MVDPVPSVVVTVVALGIAALMVPIWHWHGFPPPLLFLHTLSIADWPPQAGLSQFMGGFLAALDRRLQLCHHGGVEMSSLVAGLESLPEHT